MVRIYFASYDLFDLFDLFNPLRLMNSSKSLSQPPEP